MANSGKSKAKEFMKYYKPKEISAGSLTEIMEKQGYTVVEFGSGEDAEVLIRELELYDYASGSAAFTYADGSYRLVFMNENLSEREKLIVLAHEEGHIFCEHFGAAPVVGQSVLEEYEANEFAHYILSPGALSRAANGLRRHRTAVFISAAVIAAAIIAGGIIAYASRERQYYGDFYVTASGSKYHKAECIFVKDKDNVRRLTVEEFESGDYAPCEICLPEGSPDYTETKSEGED